MDGLPDSVLVHGVTGSGKSTAALAIGARTGHPVTLVDELTWLPGWVLAGPLGPEDRLRCDHEEPRCNGNVGPVSVDLPPSMLRTPRLTLEDPALEQGDTRGGQPRTIRATRRAGRRWTRPR